MSEDGWNIMPARFVVKYYMQYELKTFCSQLVSLTCRQNSAAPSPAKLRRAEHLGAVKILLGRGAPDAGLARGPALGTLRRIVMPGARLEIAELLVLHLVELAEELDHLVVLVAMVGGDVV